MRFHPAMPRRLGAWILGAALLAASGATAAQAPATPLNGPPQEPYGWPWLVRALDRLKPATDTRIPETSTEAAQRFEDMISQGRAAEALAEIETRQAQRARGNVSGVDARMLFLQARALAALGDLGRARAIYEGMTVSFPELPEPWNNLAAIHAAQGRPEQAREALEMALLTNPGYAAAQANLGDVHLMLAARAYEKAAAMGVPRAATLQQQTQRLLEPESP